MQHRGFEVGNESVRRAFVTAADVARRAGVSRSAVSRAFTPGASVSIENVATGSIAKGVTNAVGFYSIPNLPPGTYEIKTSAPGFATEVRSGITLTVGEELVLNVSKGSIGKRTGNAAPCSFTGTQRCARPSMRSRISGTRRSL